MKTTEQIIKCPICQQTSFKINKVKDFVNDYGGIIVKINKCGHIFPFSTVNPQEASLLGADKLEMWDNEFPEYKSTTFERYGFDEKKNYAFEMLEFLPGIEIEEFEFEIEKEPIYFDFNSEINFEKIAYEKLENLLPDIQSSYNAYINYYLKSKGGNPKYVYIIFPILDDKKAFFYREFRENIDFNVNIERNLLADVTGVNLKENLEGTFSKHESLDILRKLIIRWNILYQHVLIATPFVSHDFNKKKEVFELWEWILNYSIPKRTTLLTRKKTLDKFKKVAAEQYVDLEKLKEFNLHIPVVEEYFKKQDFHAKFYAGISIDYTEVISGSVNVLKGPSIENLSFNQLQTNAFNKKYIEKMKIPQLNIVNQSFEILIFNWNKGKIECKVENQNLDAREIIEKYQ